MPGVNTGFNYTDIVKTARKVPREESDYEGNVTELIPLVNGDTLLKNPFVEEETEATKPAPELYFGVFSRVFVLWRPWEACPRCKVAFKDLTDPTDDEVICPHNQAKEYKETVDRCLKGDGIIAMKEAYTLQNGVRCVHLEWLEPDPTRLKELQELEKKRKENQVYPPDLEAAFAK